MPQMNLTELIEEIYDQIIQHTEDKNDQCSIFLCNSCPRAETVITELNDLIKSVTEHYRIVMIDIGLRSHPRQRRSFQEARPNNDRQDVKKKKKHREKGRHEK